MPMPWHKPWPKLQPWPKSWPKPWPAKWDTVITRKSRGYSILKKMRDLMKTKGKKLYS